LGRLYNTFLDGVFTCLETIAELEFFKIVYPSGAPILPDLLRYQALAVNDYGSAARLMPCISPRSGSYDRQTGRLQDSGNRSSLNENIFLNTSVDPLRFAAKKRRGPLWIAT
jgi:hypothetical protein